MIKVCLGKVNCVGYTALHILIRVRIINAYIHVFNAKFDGRFTLQIREKKM